MGFLDKLLGRDKDTATTTEAPADVGEQAPEPPAEEEAPVSGEASDLTQSEQRLDSARDQNIRDEGRIP